MNRSQFCNVSRTVLADMISALGEWNVAASTMPHVSGTP